jgi:hypothetical protein
MTTSENIHVCELCVGLSPMAHEYCRDLHAASLENLYKAAREQGMSDEEALDMSNTMFHVALCDCIKDGTVRGPAVLEQHIRNTERVAKVKAVVKRIDTPTPGEVKHIGSSRLVFALGVALVWAVVFVVLASH